MALTHVQAKSSNMRPLIVIPGPRAPKNLRPYLEATLDAFARSACDGIQVTEAILPAPAAIPVAAAPAAAAPAAAAPIAAVHTAAPPAVVQAAADATPAAGVPAAGVPGTAAAAAAAPAMAAPRSFKHKAFLSAVQADSIARQKVARWPAPTAYFSCGWCINQGVSCAAAVAQGYLKEGISKSTVYPMGYHRPQEQSMHARCVASAVTA